MHLQKLVEVLKKLDEEQIKRLDEYVRSPYFRVPPVCVLLLNRLMPLHPRFMETKMQWQKLGKKDITLSTIAKQRNAATGLLKAIDGFIAQEQWQLNKLEITRLKLKGYKQLQLEDKFEDGYKEQMAFLEDEPEQDIDTFYEKHMLVELSMQGVTARLKFVRPTDLDPIIKTFDEYYSLKKLRYACEISSRYATAGLDYPNDDAKAMIHILEKYVNPNYPYVYLFVNIYRMLSEGDYLSGFYYYDIVKKFISDRERIVVSQSVREAVDYVTAYCLRWFNRGNDDAGREYLWWIDWRLRNGLLLQKGRLMPVTFRNIVSAAQSQSDTEKMADVINSYMSYLPSDHLDSNLSYAKGLYNYALHNYKTATRFFLTAEAKDEPIFNCLIRYWHWKSLYEYDSNDIDSLYNSIDSFEKYIKRNLKHLKSKAKSFEIFLIYCMELLRVENKESLLLIIDRLQLEKQFAGKRWLIEKFESKRMQKANT
jgi:hypothetical protein